MNEYWERIQSLFVQAADLRPEERARFLDTACAEDKETRREVESLLAHDGVGEERISEALAGTAQSLVDSVTIKSGSRIGDYEVQGLIGSGGMGEVYRARDARLSRNVAIKVLPRFLTNDPERLRRFEQEAQAAAALNHPNILVVYQMGVYEGAPYLVSELLEGSTLRELMKQGPLPSHNAVDYGVQIARGLASAHREGITHRDLKPENLFATKDGHVKILDFGLAKLTHTSRSDCPATEAGIVVGTVGYMSPEQVRGEAVDYRTDFFAFGAILYEMLSGQRAFNKPTGADTMSAILNEDPPGISQLQPTTPPALQRVVQRCLEKNREQRFQSASDLAFALEALSDSGTIAVSSVKTEHGRWRRLSWFAAVLAIIAAALGLWWKTPGARPKVETVRQLTDDGELKATVYEAGEGSLASDGSRVYFNERRSGKWMIAQVSVRGGQSAPVNTAVPEPIITGIAPDSSSLLTLNGWLLPVPAGSSQRLGDLANLDLSAISYFPDGQHIIYAAYGSGGSAIHIADRDGFNAKKLLQLPAYVLWLSVSPDGGRVRFTIINATSESLWEIKADGTALRKVLNGWKEGESLCCGKWTKDGRYFVFLVGRRSGPYDIWALPEEKNLLRGASVTPTQLTNGPLSYYLPLPSADNETVFAVGALKKGQLTRYDGKRGEFVPFLGGISATNVMPSRDGQWVVFLSYPDGVLWRSRIDGSDRMQLSQSRALFPQISPDGGKVVFVAPDSNTALAAYVVSIEGGRPQRVAEEVRSAAWSPDGSQLVFQTINRRIVNDFEIRTIDLRTKEIRAIPGSRGMLAPLWPNPDTVVAGSPSLASSQPLVAFDFKSQKWSPLVNDPVDNWVQSSDGRCIYFQKSDASGTTAFRIWLADRRIERVADLSGANRVEEPGVGTWLGVAPDGSALITRDIGVQEIYALDVKWP